MFSKFFIERPIFATVLALLFVVAGLVTLNILPVAQYPDITPPTVQVSAVYPGANAETVAQTVGIPIEQQVNGVDGMLYMIKYLMLFLVMHKKSVEKKVLGAQTAKGFYVPLGEKSVL